jgi:hypothetical protein
LDYVTFQLPVIGLKQVTQGHFAIIAPVSFECTGWFWFVDWVIKKNHAMVSKEGTYSMKFCY